MSDEQLVISGNEIDWIGFYYATMCGMQRNGQGVWICDQLVHLTVVPLSWSNPEQLVHTCTLVAKQCDICDRRKGSVILRLRRYPRVWRLTALASLKIVLPNLGNGSGMWASLPLHVCTKRLTRR